MKKNKEQRLQKQVDRLERDLEHCRKSLETPLRYWMGVGKKKMEAETLLKDMRDTSVGTDWYFGRIDEYFNFVKDNNK